METGRPQVVSRYSTQANGEDVNTTNICPAALGTKDQQPAAFSPKTGLFYVPTNHVCMDYEPYKVSATRRASPMSAPPSPCTRRRAARTWATSSPGTPARARSTGPMPEPFSVWSGALATAGDVVFYGTLEGYLKAVDANTGRELYRFKTPSGIIGNVNTWMHKGEQYVGVLSGVGGWAGIGLAAGLTAAGQRPGLAQCGRPRRRGRQDHRHRRPRRRRCLQVAQQLHPARRSADRLQAGQLSLLDQTIVTAGARRRKASGLSFVPDLQLVSDAMRLAIPALALAVAGRDRSAAADRVALLPFELVNTSLEATRPDEVARIAMLDRMVTERMAAAGLEMVDPAPVAAEVAARELAARLQRLRASSSAASSAPTSSRSAGCRR